MPRQELLVAARVSGRPGAAIAGILPSDGSRVGARHPAAHRRAAGAGHRRLEMLAAAGPGPDQCGADPRADDFPHVALRHRGDRRHRANRARSRVRAGTRSSVARHAVFGSGRARRDRRNAAGARTPRHALCRSRGRRLARDDGRLRAEPGSLRRAGRRRRPRCAAGRVPGHDQRRNGASCRRTTAGTATGIRCVRSSGSRISWRRATRACARDRSSPPARTRARSRFR